MAKQLASKVAIVTGTSRGIGRAVSVALAQEAATVVLAARSIQKLQETSDKVTEAGGKAEIVVTELTGESKGFRKQCGANWGTSQTLPAYSQN